MECVRDPELTLNYVRIAGVTLTNYYIEPDCNCDGGRHGPHSRAQHRTRSKDPSCNYRPLNTSPTSAEGRITKFINVLRKSSPAVQTPGNSHLNRFSIYNLTHLRMCRCRRYVIAVPKGCREISGCHRIGSVYCKEGRRKDKEDI